MCLVAASFSYNMLLKKKKRDLLLKRIQMDFILNFFCIQMHSFLSFFNILISYD